MKDIAARSNGSADSCRQSEKQRRILSCRIRMASWSSLAITAANASSSSPSPKPIRWAATTRLLFSRCLSTDRSAQCSRARRQRRQRRCAIGLEAPPAITIRLALRSRSQDVGRLGCLGLQHIILKLPISATRSYWVIDENGILVDQQIGVRPKESVRKALAVVEGLPEAPRADA